jgi:hypothetical protein
MSLVHVLSLRSGQGVQIGTNIEGMELDKAVETIGLGSDEEHMARARNAEILLRPTDAPDA